MKKSLLLISLVFSLLNFNKTYSQSNYDKLLSDLGQLKEDKIVVLVPEVSCWSCVSKHLNHYIANMEDTILSKTVVVSNISKVEQFELDLYPDENKFLDRTVLSIGNITFCRISKNLKVNCHVIDNLEQPLIQKSDLFYPN